MSLLNTFTEEEKSLLRKYHFSDTKHSQLSDAFIIGLRHNKAIENIEDDSSMVRINEAHRSLNLYKLKMSKEIIRIRDFLESDVFFLVNVSGKINDGVYRNSIKYFINTWIYDNDFKGYDVVCDSNLNTPEVINDGVLKIQIVHDSGVVLDFEYKGQKK